MIQRRQFLGTVAAISALAPAHLFAGNRFSPTTDDPIGWKCRVIETLNHNQAQRFPVVTDVSIQQTGNLLAIVGDDHFVCIYDTVAHKYVEHLKRHRDWVRAAKFSPNGKLLATAGNDRQLFIWEADNWQSPKNSRTHPEAIFDIAFSPDGNSIASVGFESKLRIYDPASGLLQTTLECPCPDMHAVAISNDNQLIAAGGRCGNIRVWNAISGEPLTQFPAHRQRIRTIQFGANNLILSAGDDQIVKLTNPLSPSETRSLPRHAAKLYAVKLLGGGLVATAGSDNLIHIWRIDDATRMGVLKGHTGTVTSLDSNQTHLVSGSYDTQVRIWDMKPVTTATRPGSFKQPNQPADEQLNRGWNRK